MPKPPKVVLLPCMECGATVECAGRAGLQQARKGRAYCSDECRARYTSRLSSERMAETNRRYASARMRERNPMRHPDVRNQVSETLRAIGHAPTSRGGNGRPPPEPQRLLAEALGWPMEVIVRTRVPKINPLRLPTHFKVDIAHREMKIAIEVDGGSHTPLERRAQDAKKTAHLLALEWQVFRFSNEQVMADLAGCVQTVTSTISRLRATTTISRRVS